MAEKLNALESEVRLTLEPAKKALNELKRLVTKTQSDLERVGQEGAKGTRATTQAQKNLQKESQKTSNSVSQLDASFKRATKAAEAKNAILQAQIPIQRAVLSGSLSLEEAQQKMAAAAIAAKTGNESLASSLSKNEQEFKKNQTAMKSLADTAKRSSQRIISGFSRAQATIVTLNQGAQLLSRAFRLIERGFDATVGKALQAGDAFAKLSQASSISVETLSGFSLASDLAGVGMDTMARGLRRLNQHVIDATEGSNKSARAFESLGVTVTDASGDVRSSEAILLDVADAFAGAEDSAAKTAIAMQIFGRTGTDLIPLLNLGSDAIREQQGLAEELGLTFSTKTAKAAELFNDTLNLIGKSIQGVFVQITQSLLPELNAGATAMLAWAKANQDWLQTKIVESFQTTLTTVRNLIPQFANLASIFGDLIRAFSSLPPFIQQVGIVGALIGGKVGLAVGATLAVLAQVKEFLQESAQAGNPFAKFVLGSEEAAIVSANLSGALTNLGNAANTTAPTLDEVGTASENAGKGVLTFNTETDKTTQKAKQAATTLNQLADSQRALAREQAEALGDIAGLREAELSAIESQKAKELAAENLTAQARAAIHEKALVEIERAELRLTGVIIDQLQERQAEAEHTIGAQAQFIQDSITAQITLIASEQALLQEELTALQERGGTLADQINVTQQLTTLEITRLQNSLAASRVEVVSIQDNIRAQQALIKELEKRLQLEQDLAQQALIKKSLQDANEELRAQQGELQKAEAGAKSLETAIVVASKEGAREIDKLSHVTFSLGKAFEQTINQIVNALVSGTLKIKDIFRSLATGIIGEFTRAFAEAFAAKLDFEVEIAKNFGGAGGIVGTIASAGKAIVGALGGSFDRVLVGLDQLMGKIPGTITGGITDKPARRRPHRRARVSAPIICKCPGVSESQSYFVHQNTAQPSEGWEKLANSVSIFSHQFITREQPQLPC